MKVKDLIQKANMELGDEFHITIYVVDGVIIEPNTSAYAEALECCYTNYTIFPWEDDNGEHCLDVYIFID